MMKRVNKTNNFKSFEKVNVGEIELTVLHRHQHLNLGRMQPFLLSLPFGAARENLPPGSVDYLPPELKFQSLKSWCHLHCFYWERSGVSKDPKQRKTHPLEP